jgi:hypothetical protein
LVVTRLTLAAFLFHLSCGLVATRLTLFPLLHFLGRLFVSGLTLLWRYIRIGLRQNGRWTEWHRSQNGGTCHACEQKYFDSHRCDSFDDGK